MKALLKDLLKSQNFGLFFAHCAQMEQKHQEDVEMMVFVQELKRKAYIKLGEKELELKCLKSLSKLVPENYKYKLLILRHYDRKKMISRGVTEGKSEKPSNILLQNLTKLKIYQPEFLSEVNRRLQEIEKKFNQNYFLYQWE